MKIQNEQKPPQRLYVMRKKHNGYKFSFIAKVGLELWECLL